MVLSNFQNSGRRYKVTSPMSKYQGQLKGVRFTKNIQILIVLDIPHRQFTDVCISCLNKDLLRHWVHLEKSCLSDILKTSHCLSSLMETLLKCYCKMSKKRFY